MIKSGRPFKRRCWTTWTEIKDGRVLQESMLHAANRSTLEAGLLYSDVLADDWEIQEDVEPLVAEVTFAESRLTDVLSETFRHFYETRGHEAFSYSDCAAYALNRLKRKPEQIVTITASQFWEAANDCLGGRYNSDVQNLARKLGLEPK